ncbi:MAG: hypothetical protein U0324_44170 [Polyangiales bacterium]
MTAISADKNRKRLGESEGFIAQRLPVAAVKVPAGAMVAMNTSGYMTNAGATSSLKIIGVNQVMADNSGGSAGDISSERVERGTYLFANSTSTDEITAADIGAWCYAVDNNTVAKTDNTGARPKAGKIVGVESSGVWVEVGVYPV